MMVNNSQIAGFGNPLLDISIILKECSVLRKYNLELDGQKEVDDATFQDVLESLKWNNLEMSQNPGGCAQNTMRIIQSILNYPKICAFFGGLGDDDEGRFVEEEVRKCGVETRYTKHRGYCTGKVAALISGENRCLVANLGAANVYKMEHFMIQENLSLVEKVAIIYIEGFFITHSFDVAVKVAKLGHQNGAVVIFNISGAYVAEKHPEHLISMASMADLVIGNFIEFEAMAKVMDLHYVSSDDLAVQVNLTLSNRSLETTSQFKLKHFESFGKTVIVTKGKDPVHAVCKNTFVKYTIPDLDVNLVKDATGAGDAFAAGILVSLLQTKSLEESVSFGCKVAQAVIQQIGVQLPKDFHTEELLST